MIKYFMTCAKCGKEFEEKDLDNSHDIPKYLNGTDSDGKHWLCKDCHNEYECLILKDCLKYLGGEFKEEEKIEWMKELSKIPEGELKSKLRFIARKIKEEYYG